MLKCLLVSVQQSNAGVYFYMYFVCCLQKVVVGGHGSSRVCDHINVPSYHIRRKVCVYIFTNYCLCPRNGTCIDRASFEVVTPCIVCGVTTP